MSENCAFLKIHTTGNDLYGNHNCPIQFFCEIYSQEDIEGYPNSSPKRKSFNICPDERIMPSGFISSGFDNDMLETMDSIPLAEALEKIYRLMTFLKERGYYIMGYSHVNFDLRILNEHFKRILGLEPVKFDPDRIIDVMKIAEYALDVGEVGCYSLDSVYCRMKMMGRNSDGFRKPSDMSDMEKMVSSYVELLRFASGGGDMPTFSKVMETVSSEVNKDGPEKFNFGKYKGLEVEKVFDIDRGYCSWLMGNRSMCEAKPEYIRKLKNMMNEVE